MELGLARKVAQQLMAKDALWHEADMLTDIASRQLLTQSRLGTCPTKAVDECKRIDPGQCCHGAGPLDAI